MILSPRHKAASAALLILGVLFVPALTGFAAGAIGVRANAGPSQVASVGDTVTVDGSRSYTLSGNNLTYTWDFDEADGIQADATGVIASHLYNETGVFTVTLTAADGAQSDTDNTQVIVTSTNGTVPGVPNLPPVSIPPLTQLGFQNQSMVFDGTRSFDPNGDNLTFEWDFNDLDGLTPGGDANGSVVAWIYYAPGVYNITLIVSDGQGSDAGRTSAIVAADNGTVVPGVNLPPVAVAEGDQFGQEGERFYFNANRSFDLDGDDLRYMWDFDSTNGRTQINAEGIVVSKVFTAAGIYNITLTVSDGKAQDTDFLEVIVTTELGGVPGVGNLPPIAIIRSPIPGQRYAPLEAIQFDACTSIDPDGDDALILYQWTWPDGSPVSTICDPTHAFAEGGLKVVQLLIQDVAGTNGFNTVSIYVNGSGPLNRQPSGDIESNTTTRVGLGTNFTANFTDPDNDPLTFAWDFDLRDGVQEEATGRNVTWVFTDPCSCTVTVLVLDGQHRGTPVIAFQNMQVDAKETFPPTARAGNDTTAQAGQGIIFDGSGNDTDGNITLYEWDFEGDGIFDYSNAGSGWTISTYPVEGNYSAVLRVTDDDRLTATDTRRVIVTPRPNNLPVADAGPDKASETQGVQTFFHGTGTDSDGFITLFEWDFDSNGIYDWSNSTAGDAFHTYTSAGTYAAVLRVTDDRAARATDVALVTVRLNQPPTADAGPPQTVNAGEQVTLSGTGARDPEGAIAKYSWDFDSSDGIQEEYTGVTAVHTYTKGNSYLVTLTVTDGFGQTSVDNVFVEVLQHGGVNLAVSDNGRKELAPEQSSSYLLNVTNSGDGTDSFKIDISGDNEEALIWYSVDAATISNLEAGGVRIVRLTVAIPRGTLADQETLIKVTATSVFDDSKISQVDVDTAVKAVPKIQVSFISFPTEVQAGSSIDVTVRVQNLGNADARVAFIAGGGDSGWLTVTTVLPQTIKPLKSLDLDFTLTVPPGTSGGTHTVAVSINDTRGNVRDTESIQLNVKGGGGILPALQAPALILGLVAVAALLIRGSGPRRRR